MSPKKLTDMHEPCIDRLNPLRNADTAGRFMSTASFFGCFGDSLSVRVVLDLSPLNFCCSPASKASLPGRAVLLCSRVRPPRHADASADEAPPDAPTPYCRFRQLTPVEVPAKLAP